ncbi:MAG: hypothetical protein II862_04770 [Bacteroidales bacterium]|nr:hypothetical protein [Bacteroidales bacterium]
MSKNPMLFHGEWWVPAQSNPRNQLFLTIPVGHEKRHVGTLTYCEDGESTLELYHIPSDFHAMLDGYNNVMWGVTANGAVFSLFNVVMEKEFKGDFTKTKFIVGLILVGEHLISMRKPHYDKCIVQFPYLRNWAFRDNLIDTRNGNTHSHVLVDPGADNRLIESQVEDGMKWVLRDKFYQNRTSYELNITQTTELLIESTKPVSIEGFLNHIGEFCQFLSIALYGEQNPNKIRFASKAKNVEMMLLYEVDKSVDPLNSKLIKFEKLKDKVPTMLKLWHECYDKIAPISSYLIESLQKKKTFNVPDFLIIAQALDGFHKRFVNKKNGKDHRKYEKQIEILLKQFKDVEMVQKCNIDPKVLCDTRNKYSHLYPDDEKSLAVDGDELYWLTEKCKILLACCILSMMDLSNEEINLCCEDSPISKMIETHLFGFE